MSENNEFRSTGRFMLGFFWILCLSLLTFLFSRVLQHQTNPNQTPRTSATDTINEVILEKNKFHHYVVSGKINGTEVVFLVDTGATQVAIPPDVANRIGLQPGFEGRAQTANGWVRTRSTIIDSLQIGAITLKDVRGSITYGMEGEEILLGMSALRQVEFSHRDGQLTLRQYTDEY